MAPHNADFPPESFSILDCILTLHEILFMGCQKLLHCENKTCCYAFGLYLFFKM